MKTCLCFTSELCVFYTQPHFYKQMKQHSLPFLLLLAHRPIIRSRFHCKKMTLREIDSIENWILSNQFLYCLQPPLINTKQEVVEKSSNFMTFIIYQRQVRALRLFFQLFTLMDREGGSQNVHVCPQGGRGGSKKPKKLSTWFVDDP